MNELEQAQISTLRTNFEREIDNLKAEIAALKVKPMPQSTQSEAPPANQMIRDAGDFIKLAESIKNMLPKQPTLMEQLKDMVALKGALADLNDSEGVADIADTAGNPEDAMLMKLLDKMILQKEAPPAEPPEEKPIIMPPKNPNEIKPERKAWIDAELKKLTPKAVNIAKTKPKEWVKKRIQDQIPLTDAEFEYAYHEVLKK